MHVEKVKLAGGNFARLVGHMRREHKHYKNYVDTTKSNANISLKPYTKDLEGFIRGKGVTRIRKDSVGAYNAVCTVAKEDQESLKTATDYKSWGWTVIDATLKSFNLTRDDICGAEIHLDETNPHIHFSFVPLFRENEKVTLSAKKVGNRKAFKDLHDILQAEMQARGFKGAYVGADEVRGLSKESLAEYKKAKDILPKLEKELSEYKRNNQILKADNQKLVDENKKIYAQIKDLEKLKAEISKLSFLEKIALNKIKKYEVQLAKKDKYIKELESVKASLFAKVDRSPSQQLQALYKQSQDDINKLNARISQLSKDNQHLSKDNAEMADRLGLSEDRMSQKQGLDRVFDEIMKS